MTKHFRPDIISHCGFRVEFEFHTTGRTLFEYTAKSYDGYSPIGHGATRDAAMKDLLHKMEAIEIEDNPRDHLTANWDRAQSYRKNGEWA